MAQYFVDNGDGTEYYDTEAEARKAAQDWIDEYRTLPEWDETVERVCWGVVREYAKCVYPNDNIYCDFVLKEPE